MSARRFYPKTVEAPFEFDLPGGHIETTATVCAEYGEIISVKLGGLSLTPDQAAKAVGADEFARQSDVIHDMTPDLAHEAAQDAAEGYGDYLYEQRRDRQLEDC